MRTHLIASIVAGIATFLLALCFGHDIFISVTAQLVVTGCIYVWLHGPVWATKLLTKYTWSAYLIGIFLIPLVFLLQLGPFGYIVAINEGAVRALSTHFWPTKGTLYVDLAYAFLIGALLSHRLIVGF